MKIPENIQQAIQAYYAERATDEDIAALEQWFRKDEANVKAFAEHGMIEWQMLCEQEKQDAATIMAMLREAEENAEPDFSLLKMPSSFEKAPSKANERSLSFSEVLSLAGYVAATGLRSRVGVIGSIAAILMLGAVLYIALIGMGSDTPDAPEFTNNPPAEIDTVSIVATLTAEHDAVWDRRPGQDLYVGQRFTLTHGFAQITTNRGAVAILEAPATIELTDSDNAIRLLTGKLVGLCQTPSSKGFVVKTERADIIDLGTEFGVTVSPDEGMLVEVFEGLVAVQSKEDRGTSEPIEVAQGKRARMTDGAIRVSAVLPGEGQFTNRHIFDPRRQWQAHRDKLMRDPAMLAYYTFEDATDGVLVEARGKDGFDGTIHGARWAEGRFPWKRGLRFGGPGSKHRVELSQAASDLMNFDGSFSVVVWFKSEPFSSDWQTLIAKGEIQWRSRNTMWEGHPQFSGGAHEPDALNSGYDERQHGGVDQPGRTPIDDGRWHQAAIVFDADTQTRYLYINGLEDGDPQQIQSVDPTDARVWIGGNADLPKNREFHGVIDEVAIFERALNPAEIAELYHIGAPQQQLGSSEADKP